MSNMSLYNNGNLGINNSDAISKLQLREDGSSNNVDASDSATFNNYHFIMNKEGGTNTGSEIGLCMFISGTGYVPTATTTPGAAITHERTDGWSKGKMHFKTKHSSSSTGSCVTAMTISDYGSVGINTTSPGSTLHVRQLSDTNYISSGYNTHSSYALTMETAAGNDHWSLMINTEAHSDLNFLFNGYRKGYLLDQSNINQITFTGQHRNMLNKQIDETSKGLIVSSSGKYINLDNSLYTNINESLPICTITNIENDIKVFGVISDKEDSNDDRIYYTGNWGSNYNKANKNEQRMFINSLGEGAIWVCNKNNILFNGDYISSSSIAGYGQKQILNQNTLMNHTVAKITCDCDFSLTKIVKQKLKVIITTETYEENITQDVQKINTETKIKYDETLQKYIEEQITTTTIEKEQLYDIVNLYDSSGNALLDADGNARTHQVERKVTKTKTITNIDYNANGDVTYEDDLDADGNQQMIYPFETRFLQADATQITEEEYNTKLEAGESVYVACFVGCTYHCG